MSVFVDLDNYFDEVISGGALDVAAALAVPSAEFLTLLAGGALAFFAVKQAFQGHFSIEGFINFIIRFGIFYSLVAGTAVWTSFVYPYVTTLGPKLGNFLISQFGGSSSDGVGIISALASFIDVIFDASVEVMSGISGWDAFWDAPGAALAALLCIMAILFAIVFGSVAMLLIIIAKILMAVLLSITPFLAVWGFIKSTSSVFDSWIKGVTMLILFQVLVYGTLGIVLSGAKLIATDAQEGLLSGTEAAGHMLNFVVICLVATGGLLTTPMIARAVGGATIDLGKNSIARGMTGAGSAVGGSAGRATANALRPTADAGASSSRAAALNAASGGTGSATANSQQTAAARAQKIANRLGRNG